MKTILCPTDFSKGSENAVRYAIELARKYIYNFLFGH